ncbi:hypothetical protein [Streptomyces sp. NPDC051662]|uniref:hypothetical protein n=1 Tax=Streptomyces sp. NPDC051662 TaxID=3154750 RepID=UPI003440F3B4
MGKMLTREKAQGERAAMKRLLSTLGFDNPKALAEFVSTQREAERAALSEVERREQVAQERELQAARREEPAAERERAALRRAALVALGRAGDGQASGPDPAVQRYSSPVIRVQTLGDHAPSTSWTASPPWAVCGV